MIGAQVPVIALALLMAAGGWLAPLVVLAIGIPVASLVAFLVIQPAVNALIDSGRLHLHLALSMGAAACALATLVLKFETIIRTILRHPAETGRIHSQSFGLVILSDGMYTPAGWLVGVIAPAAVFATLGMLGGLVAWRLAFGSYSVRPPQ